MNFRRWITAVALLALCVGFASAQVTTGGTTASSTMICQANVAVPPQLRSEGMTELIGDIVISCTGGTALPPGSPVPAANITVSLGTNVTSRLLSGATGNPSEALLLIDEPNSSANPAAGAGPNATFTPCGTLSFGGGGCPAIVASTSPTGTGPAAGQSATSCSTTAGVTSCTAAPNEFIGLVNANQVSFLGIPVNPPTTAGISRVFRITNVRANVSALGGGGLAGTTQLLASVSISGSSSLLVANPVLIAGFIQSGLSTSLRNTANSGSGSSSSLAQCGGGGPNALSILRYTENFATAFKTRVAPALDNSYNGQSSNPTFQSKPGTIYNSESGLVVPPIATNLGTLAPGLADYGTRVKAVFNNIPAGVNIFVSTANVTNDFQSPVTAPAGNSTASYAVLVQGETTVDGNGTIPAAGTNSSISFGSGASTLTINIVQLSVVGNTATAVWEVVNTNPLAIDTLDFGVYQSFTANPGANSPPAPSTATVNMSYAPTPPSAFTASAGGTASGSLTIPRFADTSSASNIFSIALCQTVLLFPYVTNIGGFDTGLAIANTSTDPFSTRAQNGSCTLNFYGASAPPAVNTGNVATGTVYTTLTSTSAAGFNGYMIAVCNFQLAHGFAFVSDIGARNLAMGYLALVVSTGTGNRNNITEALNN